MPSRNSQPRGQVARRGRGASLIVVLLALTALLATAGTLWTRRATPSESVAGPSSASPSGNHHPNENGSPTEETTSDSATGTSPVPETSDSKRFPVHIRKPAGPPRVSTGRTDANGREVTVACSTCHATRRPDFGNKTAADLKEFHSDLSFLHGNIGCLACHDSTDYDALHLADGSRVEFADVMTLCAQCHGPQMRDYQHGVHGGMNGYWDRSRGPQTKNHCVDCHHPHSPQFPMMRPTFKPRDRFLDPRGAAH